MAIVVGVDTYVSVEDADAYFLTRIGSEKWVASDEATKEAALVTATNIFNTMAWGGEQVDPLQLFAFPRKSAFIVVEGMPQPFLNAVCEEALHLIKNPEVLEDSGGVESLDVGSISLTKIRSPELVPSYIYEMISPYTRGGSYFSGVLPGSPFGGSLWWRAW